MTRQTVRVVVPEEGQALHEVCRRALHQAAPSLHFTSKIVIGKGAIYQHMDDLAYAGDRFNLDFTDDATGKVVVSLYVAVVGADTDAATDFGEFKWAPPKHKAPAPVLVRVERKGAA